MTIKIPKEIENNFLNLLNIAQSSITEEELEKLNNSEKKCLKFVEDLLGQRASTRWKNRQESSRASKLFSIMCYI